MPRSESSAFGIIGVDEKDNIQSFLEKPADPPAMPGKPDKSLASMGIYVFDSRFLFEQLRRDANDPSSSHDFGKDVIPYIVKNGRAVAHQFSRSCVRSGDDQRSYWRDVGTVDAYWSSNIDLTDVVPELDLPYVNVGQHARLRNVVIDRGVRIPDGLVVGEDPDLDSRRFRTTPQDICLITQPMIDGLNA